MERDLWVPDANVFLEYIFGRKHADRAKRLITDAILGDIHLVAPSLMMDEITEVLCGNQDHIDHVRYHLTYIERLSEQGVLFIVVPNTQTRMKAIEIARTGHLKSGFPEYSDSLYHALAIMNNGTFLTNDERHVAKVRKLGHTTRLSTY